MGTFTMDLQVIHDMDDHAYSGWFLLPARPDRNDANADDGSPAGYLKVWHPALAV